MRFLICCLVLFVAGTAFMVQAQRGNLSTDQRVLTGTDWRLVSFGPAGAEIGVIAGTTVTLKFGEDERVSGSAGCNLYGGTYEVRGDSLSLSRLSSTRRACLDQNANQQEQRFLAALEAASRFRLAANRLTILSDRGRTVLNFTRDTPEEPDDGPTDDRTDPVKSLEAYYNAINSRNYRRAYRVWESPASSYEQFVRGFADTQSVRFLVDPTVRLDGAAGSTYAEIPTIVIANTRAGREQTFAGCYVMRKSNVQNGAWQIYRADISMVRSNARLSRILSQACRNSQ